MLMHRKADSQQNLDLSATTSLSATSWQYMSRSLLCIDRLRYINTYVSNFWTCEQTRFEKWCLGLLILARCQVLMQRDACATRQCHTSIETTLQTTLSPHVNACYQTFEYWFDKHSYPAQQESPGRLCFLDSDLVCCTPPDTDISESKPPSRPLLLVFCALLLLNQIWPGTWDDDIKARLAEVEKKVGKWSTGEFSQCTGTISFEDFRNSTSTFLTWNMACRERPLRFDWMQSDHWDLITNSSSTIHNNRIGFESHFQKLVRFQYNQEKGIPEATLESWVVDQDCENVAWIEFVRHILSAEQVVLHSRR